MIKDIVARQIEFQKAMNSNSDVMFLAVVEELGEMVASTGYADWKKVKRDEANIKIELIDIAVFSINLAYYDNNVHESLIANAPAPTSELELVQKLVTYLAAGDYNSMYYMVLNYDKTLQDVITAKQALNTLRQDYGYKDGKYVKIWGNEGEEDNTFLEALYGSCFETVYDKLEEIYCNKILPSSLVDVTE